MTIVKSIGIGLLIILVGPWLAFLPTLLFGALVSPITERKLSGLQLVKFRYYWQFGWRGFTIGLLNAFASYYFNLSTLVLIVLFSGYLVFFMKHKTEYVLNRLAEGDINMFKKINNKTEIITFVSYLIGLCLIVGA